jgi:hypothetical protein
MARNIEKSKEQAQVVSDMVNNFSFDYKGFCEAMTCEHRTLQQSFTRLCIEWLQTCASDEYRFDDRNEQSHIVAEQIVNSLDAENLYLPMI